MKNIHSFHLSIALALLYFVPSPLWAYQPYLQDGDLFFKPSFGRENYIDIVSMALPPEEAWQQSRSYNRINFTGGSLDFRILQTDFTWQHREVLTPQVEFRSGYRQHEWIRSEPNEFWVEMGFVPCMDCILNQTYFSVFGTPTYQKRESDMGLAFEWGQRNLRYLRLYDYSRDIYFNGKNDIDSQRYSKQPSALGAEFGWHSSQTSPVIGDWGIWFAGEQQPEWQLDAPEQALSFSRYHQQWRSEQFYRSASGIWHLTLQHQQQRSGQEGIDAMMEASQSQRYAFDRIHLRWQSNWRTQTSYILGGGWDDFQSQQSNSTDYEYRGTHLFAERWKRFSGWSWQAGYYYFRGRTNELGNENKLKIALRFESDDGRHHLQLGSAWNLDHLEENIGDGWHIRLFSRY